MQIADFARELTEVAVTYREQSFTLRAGGTSNWYVDHRQGLSENRMMCAAGELIVARAAEIGISYEVVAGGGVGGWAVAINTARASEASVQCALANLDKNDAADFENGYGLHGAKVEGRKVLPVDDIGSTGSSLTELIDMIRKHGGIVEHAISVSDRSRGKAAVALADIGVAYHALLELDETTGKMVPML